MNDERAILPPSLDEDDGLGLRRFGPVRWQVRLNGALFFLFVALVIFATLVLNWSGSSNLNVQAGDISSVDVRAPRPITYQSEVLTEEARTRAAADVAKVYEPLQTRVARQQLARVELVLSYIDKVRQDPYADETQKTQWLLAISDLKLTEPTILLILQASDDSWTAMASETARVLDLSMRNVIREGELPAAQRRVPSLIGFGLNDDETSVVSEIVQGLLRPNSFFDAERTETAQTEAVNAVEPVDRTIAAGEIIVRSGDRLDALDIEALNSLGLLNVRRTWRDYLGAGLLAVTLTLLMMAFTSYQRPEIWSERLQVLLLGVIFAAFVVLAKIITPAQGVVAYLLPLAAMTMLLGSLIDLSIGVIATVVVAILIAVYTGGNTEIVVYALVGSLAGGLALGRGERLNSFARAGVWIILANLTVLAIFRVSQIEIIDSRTLLELASAAVINGIFASSFTLVVYYLLGQVFGLTTSLQLLELSRPTQPLLRQLLLKAPGTYYHTLLVSNMAEEAANAIGADSLLTRVGGYYHDIGKTVRPYFFFENNRDGINPHDRLDPYTSARIIISHVSDGIDLANKYRLPQTIVNFIREHHGTTRVEYFYHMASQEHDSPEMMDESLFRYPGPRPRSRETAILMLADGCEATVRAMNPETPEEMLEVINSVINRRLLSGQLADSPLTLRDLDMISSAFLRVLQSVHHPRIKYPSGASTSPPVVPLPGVRPAIGN
ncbi:MAG: HDIG domain-containing protein [Caldilineales bacterium]|nr:HDIG domain-containing protein [Caldilineales bacterium]